MYTYIYIYIERGREKEREMCEVWHSNASTHSSKKHLLPALFREPRRCPFSRPRMLKKGGRASESPGEDTCFVLVPSDICFRRFGGGRSCSAWGEEVAGSGETTEKKLPSPGHTMIRNNGNNTNTHNNSNNHNNNRSNDSNINSNNNNDLARRHHDRGKGHGRTQGPRGRFNGNCLVCRD